MTKLRMRLEIKEISAEGSFEGLLSPYGNIDNGNDVVVAGAYTKTLKDQGNTRPLLWQHKTDVPIGNLTLEDRPDGLWCKGELLMALPEAQKAYLLIKAKIVKGLSIGFEAIKDSIENGVRLLKEIKLWEGSIVTFPMNDSALIASVKSKFEKKDDFNAELAEIQLSDAAYQMRCALSAALNSLFWAGLSKEEIVTASETVIQQFSDAYMAFIGPYVDMLTEYYGAVETWSAKVKETKAGRMISAANRDKLQGIIDTLSALIVEEAATSDEAGTSKTKAALKSEPAPDHSAFAKILADTRSLFPAA